MNFKKLLSVILAVAMIIGTTSTVFAAPEGNLSICYSNETGYWGECWGNASNSFEIKFFNDNTYMGSTSLNNINGIIDGDVNVTWSIKFNATSNPDAYWNMSWDIKPTPNMQPTRAEQWVDGVKVKECAVVPRWPDNLYPVVAATTDDDGNLTGFINNHGNATLPNALNNGGNIVLLKNATTDTGLVVPANSTVTLDLNGYDIVGKTGAIINNGALTIKDSKNIGKVYTTDVAAQGRVAVVNNGTMTIDGGWFGDSNNDTTDRNAINRGNAVKNYGDLTINGGYFTNVSNQHISTEAYAYAINTLSGGTTTINDATVYGDINGLIFSDGKTIVNDGSFTLGRPGEENNLWYLAYGDVEIKGGAWTRAFEVPSWNTGAPTFTGNVEITGGTFYDADKSANLVFPESFIADGYVIEADGSVESLIHDVFVQFKKADVDATGDDNNEEADVYDIVLVAEEGRTIHELASADLSFIFNGRPVRDGAMSHTVRPAEGVTMTKLGNRYMFNYDGVNKYEDSGVALTIGSVTVNGFGSYDFLVDEVDTNAVYSTKLEDNLVEDHVPGAFLFVNTQMDPEGTDDAADGYLGKIEGVEIVVPRRTLTVNIKFPNAVEGQVADYQQMYISVVGANFNETVDLGEFDAGMTSYSETFDVPYNSTYTVEVYGEGYRTARYSVDIRKDDKVLNFWNNVMSPAHVEEIEEGNGNAVAWNFLAGDIVADNHINIYDLSAVVSYFGEINLVGTNNGYAKYDLNRDGKIDSKDVAYVLVSWNN